jgi:triacylglycerol lipase
MAAYGGRDDGLFRGAIIESGVEFNLHDLGTSEAANKNFGAVVEAASCSDATNKLECLRSRPYNDLYEAFRPLKGVKPFPYIFPVIDGKLIPQDLVQAYKLGRFVNVPVIIGDNTDEGSGLSWLTLNVPILRFDFEFEIRWIMFCTSSSAIQTLMFSIIQLSCFRS